VFRTTPNFDPDAGPVANVAENQLLENSEEFNWLTQRTPLLTGSANYLQWTNEMVEAQRIEAGEQIHTHMHVEGRPTAYDRD
jgi:hypothetical protein